MTEREDSAPPGPPATAPAATTGVVRVRQAFLLVAVTLGLLAVLRASAMVHAGEGMRPGLTRTLVLGVARPTERITRTVHLDEPDRWLSRAFGHDAKSGGTFSELASAASRAEAEPDRPGALGPGAAGSHRSPLPPRHPTAADPLRVLVTGDSLTESLGPSIMNSAPATIRAQTETRFGTGLVRPDFFDWATHARAQITQRNPELVIVAMGGNDGQGITLADGTVLPAGSDAWTAEYQRRAIVVMRIWSGDGARRVLWLSLPPARSDQLNGYFRRLNEATLDATTRVVGARYLDLTPWLSKNGAYSDYLTGTDGNTVLARARDGVHLSLDGARIAAGHVLETVRSTWNLR
ncbi:hypothetical protein ThrDRAFT_00533 [Frankia casuarinae]|uniref:Uncharacterized protein n=1 Tax=Frankia casuarinae (strain DSM 45818 / CECT 9043 / HFP020203 / CcI3) TaxID=106370 RepID=Q2J630_FRACC|nr:MULTISPECIES: DUF459 domain-containing protein [Frankia]ABD13262.1 conserved hypothetical protein [Frankia casuarinae]ETA03866.1 hypothetical protein CcI6DRAFT_00703 [Frankia sp. CcI6]EYT93783.1 hypothetical protein ThrDRAFT_00533 [Frankia casuarinae]KDA44427.1 hypothetical protein BMG523Draft_00601 [Frankia sp. BMG5.23]OAA26270.1 hypothetical protein AAY23_103244 [Frankia casuarinae]